MRPRFESRARTTCGWTRGAWLWLIVLAWVANLGHLTLVSHTVCRDHGELIHTDDHHDEVAPTPSKDTGASRTVADSGDHDGGHAHDHCWAHADDLVPTATSNIGEFTSIVWVSTAWPVVDRTSFVARLFLRAPKTSPPHVA